MLDFHFLINLRLSASLRALRGNQKSIETAEVAEGRGGKINPNPSAKSASSADRFRFWILDFRFWIEEEDSHRAHREISNRSRSKLFPLRSFASSVVPNQIRFNGNGRKGTQRKSKIPSATICAICGFPYFLHWPLTTFHATAPRNGAKAHKLFKSGLRPGAAARANCAAAFFHFGRARLPPSQNRNSPRQHMEVRSVSEGETPIHRDQQFPLAHASGYDWCSPLARASGYRFACSCPFSRQSKTQNRKSEMSPTRPFQSTIAIHKVPTRPSRWSFPHERVSVRRVPCD